LLKSFEAAGFGRVQIHAPPAPVLVDPGYRRRHASALRAALASTELEPVVHAPRGLRMGSREADRAADGLLSYAAGIGASHVVYHAGALPDVPEHEDALLSEARSLAMLVPRAERLGVMIAIENLAPVFPGRQPLSANPMALRSMACRIGSDHVGLCLDLGHAHIVSDLQRTSLEALIEPVLEVVALFHVHDNLGARRSSAYLETGLDPLRLDLHLPPGRGILPWEGILALLRGHPAPALLEIHPPHRQRAAELYSSFRALMPEGDRATVAA
jgi:sugar phosphate isomerase/epimerase